MRCSTRGRPISSAEITHKRTYWSMNSSVGGPERLISWKACGMLNQGGVSALAGKARDAVHMLTSGLAAYRSTGSILRIPWDLSNMARAYAELDQFDDAWRC